MNESRRFYFPYFIIHWPSQPEPSREGRRSRGYPCSDGRGGTRFRVLENKEIETFYCETFYRPMITEYPNEIIQKVKKVFFCLLGGGNWSKGE